MNILIIDDHAVFREGLKLILKDSGGFEEIQDAKDGKEAMEICKKEKFDIIILDISLPDISGLELIKQIIRDDKKAKILVLSMHPQEHFALRALKLGASGYLTKDSATDELIKAVNKISAGKKYISGDIAELIARKLDKMNFGQLHESLSEREFEIMLFIARGDSLSGISKKLYISDKTVGTYRSRIMVKMGMTKNAELTAYCIENELI